MRGEQPEHRRARANTRRLAQAPWAGGALALCVIGPALFIGGVPPAAVPLFLAVALVLWLRVSTKADEAGLVVPRAALLGVLAASLTLAQWIPLPDMVRALLAPGIEALVDDALSATGATAWPGLSPSPADTALEAARLLGLTALFVAAAQLSWRTTVFLVAVCGTLVAAIGFVQAVLNLDSIYGLYEAQYADLSGKVWLLGTFVNPNHQAGLLLLGIFSAAALAADQRHFANTTRDLDRLERYSDRSVAALGALLIQLVALVLTLSRGALLSLAVVGSIALVVWMRPGSHTPTRSKSKHRRKRMMRLVVAAVLLAVLAAVARHSASREVSSLLTLPDRGLSAEAKFRSTVDALALVELAPALGIGRGAYIDLFPAVHSEPSHVLFTHVECVPVTMIVEWGALVGTLMVLGLAVWWIRSVMRPRGRRMRPRVIALLGLLALALQSLGDFGLEFLGSAAPACALAGALTIRGTTRLSRRVALFVGVPALAAALGFALLHASETWSRRHAHDQELMASDGSGLGLGMLSKRPLDGRLHGLLARRAAEVGNWDEARARAEIATRLRPGAVDAWLIRSAAEAARGDHEAARHSLGTGLGFLHERPSEELLRYLVARHPDPRAFAQAAPTRPKAWRLLAEALRDEAPAHADAVAAARAAADRSDPEPLLFRSALAIKAKTPALALHHARLGRQLAPDDARCHLAVVAALRSFRPPRELEARETLEHALAGHTIRDARSLGLIEEKLVGSLLGTGGQAERARARELMPSLLSRPADPRARRRRSKLARKLEESPP